MVAVDLLFEYTCIMRVLFYTLLLSFLPLGCFGAAESEKPSTALQEQVQQPEPHSTQEPERVEGAASSVWQRHPIAAPILAVVGGVLSVVGLSELTNFVVSRVKKKEYQPLVVQAVNKLRPNKPAPFQPPPGADRSLIANYGFRVQSAFGPFSAHATVAELLNAIRQEIPTLVVEQYQDPNGNPQLRIRSDPNNPNDPRNGFDYVAEKVDGNTEHKKLDGSALYIQKLTLHDDFKAHVLLDTILEAHYWYAYVYWLQGLKWAEPTNKRLLVAGLARLAALMLVKPELLNQQLWAFPNPPNPVQQFLAHAQTYAETHLFLYALQQMETQAIYPLFVKVN